jgi:hypothetical protein
MAEQEAAQVDEEPEATAEDASAEDASAEDGSMADAVDNRAAELTGGGSGGDGGGDDQPISEINRPAVDAAAAHLDDTNLDADRETLKKIQKDM